MGMGMTSSYGGMNGQGQGGVNDADMGQFDYGLSLREEPAMPMVGGTGIQPQFERRMT